MRGLLKLSSKESRQVMDVVRVAGYRIEAGQPLQPADGNGNLWVYSLPTELGIVSVLHEGKRIVGPRPVRIRV